MKRIDELGLNIQNREDLSTLVIANKIKGMIANLCPHSYHKKQLLYQMRFTINPVLVSEKRATKNYTK